MSIADCEAVTVDGGELLNLWCTRNEKLSKGEAVLLAQFLQKTGHGLEPDVRFGGNPLTAETRAVLFRLPPDAPRPLPPTTRLPRSCCTLRGPWLRPTAGSTGLKRIT